MITRRGTAFPEPMLNRNDHRTSFYLTPNLLIKLANNKIFILADDVMIGSGTAVPLPFQRFCSEFILTLILNGTFLLMTSECSC